MVTITTLMPGCSLFIARARAWSSTTSTRAGCLARALSRVLSLFFMCLVTSLTGRCAPTNAVLARIRWQASSGSASALLPNRSPFESIDLEPYHLVTLPGSRRKGLRPAALKVANEPLRRGFREDRNSARVSATRQMHNTGSGENEGAKKLGALNSMGLVLASKGTALAETGGGRLYADEQVTYATFNSILMFHHR